MLLGPVMGSFLYSKGGYQLPFYSVGVLLLSLSLFLNRIPIKAVQKQVTISLTRRSDYSSSSRR
jgi:hypothetical protein